MTAAASERRVLPWTRVQWLLLLAVGAVSATLGWQTRTDVLGVDEATYVVLAQSLESGHYRDEFLVGSPRHAQYPPGMPAWLLLVRTVAGPGLGTAVVANLLVFLVGAFFVADALRRLGMTATGIGAAAAMMLNPALLALAGTLRSEVLFITLASASLWATLAMRRRAAAPRLALAVVLAGGAFFARSAGLSVLGGVSWPALRGGRRAMIGAIAGLVLLVGLWFWYTQSAAKVTVGRSYASEMMLIGREPMGIVRDAVQTAREYVLRTPFSQFGMTDVPGTRIDTLLFASVLLGAALIGLRTMFGLWHAAALNLVLSAGLLLIWPWTEARFVSPMVPWLIVAILLGFDRVSSWFGARHRERGGLIAAVLLCGFGLTTQVGAIRVARDCRSRPSYTEPQCHNTEARHFTLAAHFIRDSIPADAVIATSKPAKVFFIANRLTVPIWGVPHDGGELSPPLVRNRTYLLLTSHTGGEVRASGKLLRHCTRWSVRASFPLDAVLLALRDTTTDTGPDACAALTRFDKDHPVDPQQ